MNILLVIFFRFAVTDLPYHVMTLQSDARVRLDVLKYKTDTDIKEVIILYIFPMFTFTH